ncbi:MAG: DUF4845 domain-containing protein [Oleiphilaceae bacterium]|nr:DUF4845 domain-containing protein [Oleiphilaceae bacterium]
MHSTNIRLRHGQRGVSALFMLIFLAMAAVILTVAFKLYPAYYEHWQIEGVVESFENEDGLENLSLREIERRFNTRLQTNNVRSFNTGENVIFDLTDEFLAIEVNYEVRVPIYRNIDAVMKFQKTFEKRL